MASTSGETEKTKKQLKLPTITKGDRKPNQQNVGIEPISCQVLSQNVCSSGVLPAL